MLNLQQTALLYELIYLLLYNLFLFCIVSVVNVISIDVRCA